MTCSHLFVAIIVKNVSHITSLGYIIMKLNSIIRKKLLFNIVQLFFKSESMTNSK